MFIIIKKKKTKIDLNTKILKIFIRIQIYKIVSNFDNVHNYYIILYNYILLYIYNVHNIFINFNFLALIFIYVYLLLTRDIF